MPIYVVKKEHYDILHGRCLEMIKLIEDFHKKEKAELIQEYLEIHDRSWWFRLLHPDMSKLTIDKDRLWEYIIKDNKVLQFGHVSMTQYCDIRLYNYFYSNYEQLTFLKYLIKSLGQRITSEEIHLTQKEMEYLGW